MDFIHIIHSYIFDQPCVYVLRFCWNPVTKQISSEIKEQVLNQIYHQIEHQINVQVSFQINDQIEAKETI